MKRKIQLFILAFISILGAFGQSGGENSLLWEISGNGIKKKSYLLGTIHVIPATQFYFPKHYTKKVKACDYLVMEIDLTDFLGQLEVAKLAMMKDTMLEDLYSPDDYNFIKKTLKDSFQVDINLFKKMKPIFVQQQISMDGFFGGEMKSYELELMQLGLKLDKSFAGLETAKEQMSILDSIPLREQASMLLESMKNIDKERASLDKMVKFYAANNLDSLTAIFDADDNQLEGHENSLIGNRNRKWIPIIEDYMQKAPCFFAVGAGHLGGEQGIIQLLKNKGYQLKPIYK